MSDFQLITGLAILISGYSQLCGGISVYLWDRVIDLAWFSSITHLCCLSFLRDYFHEKPRALLWRIPGMIILVVLLGVALIPSAQYAGDWRFRDFFMVDRGSEYTGTNEKFKAHKEKAICFFGQRPMTDTWQLYVEVRSGAINIKQQRAIFSAIVLLVGMITRLWRLHPAPTNTLLRIRGKISSCSRKWLQRLLDRNRSNTLGAFLVTRLIYCPILAVFLTLRVLADLIGSKAFEVCPLTLSGSRHIADALGLVALCWLCLGLIAPLQVQTVENQYRFRPRFRRS